MFSTRFVSVLQRFTLKIVPLNLKLKILKIQYRKKSVRFIGCVEYQDSLPQGTKIGKIEYFISHV